MNISHAEFDQWLRTYGVDPDQIRWPMGLVPASDGTVVVHISETKVDDDGDPVTFALTGQTLTEDRFIPLPITFMADMDEFMDRATYEDNQ